MVLADSEEKSIESLIRGKAGGMSEPSILGDPQEKMWGPDSLREAKTTEVERAGHRGIPRVEKVVFNKQCALCRSWCPTQRG